MPNIDQLLNKVEKRLYLNGEWKDGSEGETYEVDNPATGEIIATMASASRDDALAALDAAHEARKQWERTSPRQRAEILRKGYDLVLARTEEFATLMTLEMGKPSRKRKVKSNTARITYCGLARKRTTFSATLTSTLPSKTGC